MSLLAWIEARGIVIAITLYCLLMLFYLVLYLKNKFFCIHAMKEYGGIGCTTSLIHILISDELSVKLQAVAAVSLGKSPWVLV
jgi:hypothetical protein